MITAVGEAALDRCDGDHKICDLENALAVRARPCLIVSKDADASMAANNNFLASGSNE